MESLRPYRAMLQLGTSMFSNGKSESVRYDDILSVMKQFDGDMKNLNKKIYWQLRKEKAFTIEELDNLFKDKNNKERFNPDLFGQFGNNIRPNLLGRPAVVGRDVSSQFNNMLPFERAMSVIVYNDKMKVEPPGRLEGEMLERYNEFYTENMYSENFNEVAKEFIGKINKNDKWFGYINYLDYRIKQQQTARRNAIGNNHRSLAEYIASDIAELKTKKQNLEKELISPDGEGKEFAKKLRDGAVQSVINDVYKTKRLPKDWDRHASPSPETRRSGFRPTSRSEIESFVSNNLDLFQRYVKKGGLIKFKGIHSAEQRDLLIFHNMLEKFEHIGIKNEMTGQENLQMDIDISEFNAFKGKTWAKSLSGHDWVMDQNRTSSIIQDKLMRYIEQWDNGTKGEGLGQLFLWKFMYPKVDPFKFHYMHGRITPGFKSESLSNLKLGLRVISDANNMTFGEFQKNMVFGYMANWYNNSFRAMYGTPGERGSHVFTQMSNLSNMRTDIFKGSPLLDNIKPWEGGVQENMLNPQLQHLFGMDPRSVAHRFSHSAIDPSIVGDAVASSWWSYMPVSYIPENIKIMDYPSINGYKNYMNALQKDAKVMLGNPIKPNLLFRRNPAWEKNPYENLQPDQPTGFESFKNRTSSKVFC